MKTFAKNTNAIVYVVLKRTDTQDDTPHLLPVAWAETRGLADEYVDAHPSESLIAYPVLKIMKLD